MNKVAILLATYNGGRFVESQLRSILAQSNVEVSIFVSDDGSYDNTLEILSRYVSQGKVHIVSRGDTLFCSAANFFHLVKNVEFSDFDYVAFSDQDDVWGCDKLTAAISVITQHNCDGYSSNVTAAWYNGNKVIRTKKIKKSSAQVKLDYWFEAPGPGCTFVMKKRLVKDLQKFLVKKSDEISAVDCHDWFIYAYARHFGFSWVIGDQEKMLYRQHTSNVFGANIGLRAKIARMKRILSGWYFQQVRTQLRIITGNANQQLNEMQALKYIFHLRRKLLHSVFIYTILRIYMLVKN